jgi:hypothetical protein
MPNFPIDIIIKFASRGKELDIGRTPGEQKYDSL